MHLDALRYTQAHSDALRCTQMHSGAIRCIRRYLPAQAEQQSKPIQVAVVSKQDGALGRARHDAPLKCTEQPVQQRRILRGRALIHVLNRTQVVLPPNPLVQLAQVFSRNQSQSVAISGSSVDHQWYYLPPDELVELGRARSLPGIRHVGRERVEEVLGEELQRPNRSGELT